jgi:uncharacterized protein YdcH (DUF465 family)
MKDVDPNISERRLYHVVEERFIPLKAFIDMLSEGSDDEYHAIADILLTLYDENFRKIVEDFEAVDQKVGKVRIIYSTTYHPTIAPGTVLDLKIDLSDPTGSPEKDAPESIETPELKPSPREPKEKGEPNLEFYADDLIDQISIGYSAVDDMLKRIETEPDADAAATLAGMARVLYTNAVARKDRIIRELEKKTGKIEVLVDTSRGHAGYDLPVMGIVVHPKQEAANGE